MELILKKPEWDNSFKFRSGKSYKVCRASSNVGQSLKIKLCGLSMVTSSDARRRGCNIEAVKTKQLSKEARIKAQKEIE